MGFLNATLFKTYALYGRTKVMNPVVLQLARLYATVRMHDIAQLF